jgi:hypothetical protein
MTDYNDEYTLTMARVYAGQGHWQKAVEIYRHLVLEQPAREDLRDGLKAAEEALVAQGARKLDELSPLLQTWLKLETRYRHLKKLKRIKS